MRLGEAAVAGGTRVPKRAETGRWLLSVSWMLLACGSSPKPDDVARRACRSSCDHQRQSCPSIDAEACYGLCDYSVAGYAARRGCLDLATQLWRCDQTVEWRCSSTTTAVGEPRDAGACEPERARLTGAGCGP